MTTLLVIDAFVLLVVFLLWDLGDMDGEDERMEGRAGRWSYDDWRERDTWR